MLNMCRYQLMYTVHTYMYMPVMGDLWLVGDVVAHLLGIGDSMLGMCWLNVGDVVPNYWTFDDQCWGFGGSLWRCGGSLPGH